MQIREHKSLTSPVGDEEQPESKSRRMLLRGGLGAMPAILTLHSGAAIARSSNLISAAPPETRDSLGRTLCLDTNSVYPAAESGYTYDMGEPPRAHFNIILDREHHVERNRGSAEIGEGAMCEGGVYWYNESDGLGWQSVELPYRGIVVSSGAMTSFVGKVTDTLR